MNKKKEEVLLRLSKIQYGNIIFTIGMMIVFIAGIIKLESDVSNIVIATLIILGIAIGFVNINEKETTNFLLATLILIMLTGPFLGLLNQMFASVWTSGNRILLQIFNYLIAFITPAAVIVALKAIYHSAKDEN